MVEHAKARKMEQSRPQRTKKKTRRSPGALDKDEQLHRQEWPTENGRVYGCKRRGKFLICKMLWRIVIL
ncbi:MAG: hypothetical protein EAZ91_00310 [Cytophagales bacterium]|nr:MAG: hypothetical protein EAZ91_00310 [Cytophagales bacterium]